VAATPWLTGNHTIFGEVVEGQDIADKITKLPRNRQDKPHKPVVLESSPSSACKRRILPDRNAIGNARYVGIGPSSATSSLANERCTTASR
jgi:hypothetical protein